ncbi:YehR family lipoprotein [Gracilibacillus alcaliphilus]|uniref:YehR family lipoprotein n=1 Tax=Gracilibacillus alcaliphilus TaxID=1401441 RepID=UPI001957A1B5|nr:YehR family protein [Gracilibacillus alcaliphilus]MBM7676503.1 uncharacterized lipoprotein YehR (DUF1307 family) [Gracilibacillus alcaliphilus]
MNKWLMLCLTLLLSIALVACGSSDDTNADDNSSDDNTTEETEGANDEGTEDEDTADDEGTESVDLEGDTNSEEEAATELDIDPNGENVVTLQIDQNGVYSKLTYYADGDKVTKQTAENEIPYTALQVSNKEEAEAALQEMVAAYAEAEGIEHSIEYHDDHATESLTVDYDQADPEEMAQLTGSIVDGDTSQGISLQRSVEMLEQSGYEVVSE